MAELGIFDFIEDQFFGGSQREAGQVTSDALRDAGLLQYAGLNQTLGFLQNEANIGRQITAPQRYAGYRATAEMERQLGLTPSAPQGGFPQVQGTTFGTPYQGGIQGYPVYPRQSVPSGGSGTGAGIALGAAGLASKIPAVRNAVGGAARAAFPRISNALGYTGAAAGAASGAAPSLFTGTGGTIGGTGASLTGLSQFGPQGPINPSSVGFAPITSGQIPNGVSGGAVSGGSAAGANGGIPAGAGAAPSGFMGTLGSIGSGAGPFASAGTAGAGAGANAAANFTKFAGPATAGILTGVLTPGSKAKKAGAGAGAAAGTVIGSATPLGPIGGMIGGFIGGQLGGAIGGQLRSRNERNELSYDNTTGQFVTSDGVLRNQGDIRQQLQNGQLQPSPDYPGYFQLNAGSLDGHDLLVDQEGNVVSGTNGRDLTPSFFNIFNDSGVPQFNGQNVTNTGGGHGGYGQYDASLSQIGRPAQQPTIGIPSGEGPGGSLGGTQQIGLDGRPVLATEDGQGIDVTSNTPFQVQNPEYQGQFAANTGRYGAFEASPGYQFQLDEGLRSIQRSAAARGGLLSGRTLREMTGYATGVAAQDYGNYFNRLQNVAALGAGQNATAIQSGTSLANSSGNATQNAFEGVGNTIIGGGLARASGITGGNAQSAGTLGTIGSKLFSEFFA